MSNTYQWKKFGDPRTRFRDMSGQNFKFYRLSAKLFFFIDHLVHWRPEENYFRARGVNVNFRVKLTIVTLLLYDMSTKWYIYMYFIVILTLKDFSAWKLGGKWSNSFVLETPHWKKSKLVMTNKPHLNRFCTWNIICMIWWYVEEMVLVIYDPFLQLSSWKKNRNFRNILWKTMIIVVQGFPHQMSLISYGLLSENHKILIAYILRTDARSTIFFHRYVLLYSLFRIIQ